MDWDSVLWRSREHHSIMASHHLVQQASQAMAPSTLLRLVINVTCIIMNVVLCFGQPLASS
jgi:hypothetical protein